jgi:hypothetical protein
MAQHMNVNREWQLGGLAGALDHAANTHAPERLAPFVDEHISRLSNAGACENFAWPSLRTPSPKNGRSGGMRRGLAKYF